MLKSRALFISLEALWPNGLPEVGDETSPSTGDLALLRDYRALGYRLFGVARASHFGIGEDRKPFIDDVQARLDRIARCRLDGVIVLGAPHDPRPLWDAARRYQIDLQRSLLVTEGGRHTGVFRTAGLVRAESARRMLGLPEAA